MLPEANITSLGMQVIWEHCSRASAVWLTEESLLVYAREVSYKSKFHWALFEPL